MRPNKLLCLLLPLACHAPKVISAGPSPGSGAGDAGGRGGPDANFGFVVSDASAVETAPPQPGLDCAGAAKEKGNAGCSFYAVPLPVRDEGADMRCFAMYVVNVGAQPVKLALERAGAPISLAKVARLPRGTGRGLTYAPFDEQQGLPAGDVAILFLAPGHCPAGVSAALDTSPFIDLDEVSSGTGQSFHLTADRPVVAYQIVPYGGAGSHVTSATLLLPRESWGTTHVTATPPFVLSFVMITAAEDGTEVTFKPSNDVMGIGPFPSIRKGAVGKFTLAAGQFVRLDTGLGVDDLSGGFVTATKPISVMGGSACFNMPVNKSACDSAHQQLPPIEALGNEYAAVRYRNRLPTVDESVPWQLVGAVDGTALTYLPAAPAGAPAMLAAGQSVLFSTKDAFVVRSQDTQHPFYVAGYMTGFTNVNPTLDGPWPGDPEFVNVVPVSQYLSSYVFFTDPTYPDTSLVLVRKPGSDGKFTDVTLGCSPVPLGGWQPLGNYQYTRVDLVSGDFKPAIPGCDSGRQTISSAAPFSVTVWGWGSKQVTIGADWTGATSYAYPAGASILRANTAPVPVIE
jgi:hypothetical protein